MKPELNKTLNSTIIYKKLPESLCKELTEKFDRLRLCLIEDHGFNEDNNYTNHTCEFIDPGFGKELWCKHEGCKNIKVF